MGAVLFCWFDSEFIYFYSVSVLCGMIYASLVFLYLGYSGYVQIELEVMRVCWFKGFISWLRVYGDVFVFDLLSKLIVNKLIG